MTSFIDGASWGYALGAGVASVFYLAEGNLALAVTSAMGSAIIWSLRQSLAEAKASLIEARKACK